MTIYTNTARFDTARSMTENELRRAAPSIFAMSARLCPTRRHAT